MRKAVFELAITGEQYVALDCDELEFKKRWVSENFYNHSHPCWRLVSASVRRMLNYKEPKCIK